MSEVVISDDEIDFPMVEQADILLALVQSAFDEHATAVRSGGIIVVEEASVDSRSAPAGVRVLRLPLGRAAAEAGAPAIAATIVALGVVARLTGLVPDEAMRRAVGLRVPRDSRASNLAALEAGLRLADVPPR